LAFFFGERVLNWIRDAEMTATIAVVLVVTGVGLFLYMRSRKKVVEMVEKAEEASESASTVRRIEAESGRAS
ncbi:MAG: hypothetical protein AB7U97_21430, partial [Pirellulales bacterium]